MRVLNTNKPLKLSGDDQRSVYYVGRDQSGNIIVNIGDNDYLFRFTPRGEPMTAPLGPRLENAVEIRSSFYGWTSNNEMTGRGWNLLSCAREDFNTPYILEVIYHDNKPTSAVFHEGKV